MQTSCGVLSLESSRAVTRLDGESIASPDVYATWKRLALVASVSASSKLPNAIGGLRATSAWSARACEEGFTGL